MLKQLSISRVSLFLFFSFALTWFIKTLLESSFRSGWEIVFAFLFLGVMTLKILPTMGIYTFNKHHYFSSNFRGRDMGFALFMGLISGIYIFKQTYEIGAWCLFFTFLGSVFIAFLSLFVFIEK